MIHFINIATLYSSPQERTIFNLSKYYNNRALLEEKILSVTSSIFGNEKMIQGRKIFVKPNWVTDNRKKSDEICLRTHDSFIIALIEILLKRNPSQITIGDAPIQDCSWEKMLSKEFYTEILNLSNGYKIPIYIKDFRRVTFDPKQNNPVIERKSLSDYIIFDVGRNSYLEPISSNKNIFRVTNYNPDRLIESHTLGKHKYCITKELFDSDIVISVPKIKTHQKTGITGALKNLVGLNGDKDFLPHHRIGGTENGGDCYPGNNILRRIAEYTLDNANRNQGNIKYWFWRYLTPILWKLSKPQEVHRLAAGWYGNDTTWRMVMDLNKIAVYGRKDGTISSSPQRMIYSLSDGIIGGQGNGPLHPEPLELGVISFTNNSYINDICMATLMGFDIQKIHLLRFASKYIQSMKIDIKINGEYTTLSDLSSNSIPTIPPPGWLDYLSGSH